MTRPALSATRATAVFDLLAAYPERAFTMSDIIKGTGINIGSCHALLNALVNTGYLVRQEEGKLYSLGPALLNVGQAALKANSLIVRAQEAAEALSGDLGIGVLLTTIAGGDIMALSAHASRNGLSPGMRPGQRFPLVAPAGAHIIAWSSAREIDDWITQAGEAGESEVESWRHAISLIRSRGYQVTLRGAVDAKFSDLMNDMATGAPNPTFNARASELLQSHVWHLDQPEHIEPDEKYDVALIAAPIFDQRGKASLSLGLGGFSERLTGQEITSLAESLMRTCLDVMRNDRREQR